jgi:hypothetical protein
MLRSSHDNNRGGGDMETITTTTTDTDRTSAPAKRSSRLRRLVAGACTLLAMSGIALGATASAASATASGAQWGDYTAYCGYNRMRAEVPFYSTRYPGWTAVAIPWLFKWDPSRQQFMNYRVGYATTMTGWIQPDVEAFNNLPPGYYQMHYVVQWYYNGVLKSSSVIQAAGHYQDAGTDPLWPWALNTQRYSTSSYCYEGN